jgi:protein SCO1/2
MTRQRHAALGAGLLLLLGSIGSSWAQEVTETPATHDHAAHQQAALEQPATHDHAAHQLTAIDSSTGQDHTAHLAAMAKPGYSVSSERYVIPDVQLIDESGATVTLRSILDVDQPIAMNFIFTTCTTICPVMTATFAQMRRELGEAGAQLRLVSISIDPEYDRPEELRKYAGQFGAGSGWTFLTGDGDDLSQVYRAFDSFAGSKMNHKPLTLLKNPGSSSWIRIDGLASSADLAQEVTARLLN